MKKNYPLHQLFWEFTLLCNMNCLHCGSDCLKDESTREMPLKDFLPVLDEIKRRQPERKTFVFTLGGEPLVRKDVLKCGYEISRRGFLWGMVSNGMLIDKPMMEGLSKCGLASLAIDIDGVPEDHNWLRNSEISFDRVYNAIEYIREAPHLVWDVITCINKRNLPRLNELKRMLIAAGVRNWRCFTIVPMGRAYGNEELLLTDDELKELMEFIVVTREENKIHLSYSCEGFLGDYEMRVRDYKYSCRAGINVASVLCNGDISGCLSIRSCYAQGNIYRDSFWDVWTNRFEKYRDRRWMKRDECGDCKVFDKCQGNAMHLRRDDGSLMLCNYRKLFPGN